MIALAAILGIFGLCFLFGEVKLSVTYNAKTRVYTNKRTDEKLQE
jgi:hypothetical protein